MKAEYRRQKTLPEEQTGGSGSTWVWFKRMKHIMGGTAKGDGLVGGCDQGRPSWGEPAHGESSVPIAHAEDIGGSHIGRVPPTPDHLGDVDLETVDTPDITGSQHVRGRSMHSPLSPKFASCMRPGVVGKSNAKKRTFTDTISLANTISSFTEGTTKVEQHKMQSAERMIQLLIDSNERMTLRLAEIEMESHRKARATQMAIATLFSTMMANKAPRTSE